MNKKSVALIISPNFRDYGRKYLSDCIESVRQQDYDGKMKVFITDNETSAESFEFLCKTVPEAQLVLNKTNDGFAKGTNDSMRLALAEGFDYIATFSIHSVLKKDYISELVRAMESDRRIGVAQAMILLGDRETVLSLGDATHFLGFGYCLGYKSRAENAVFEEEYPSIHYPSGASMIFRRETLLRFGLLDEEYWMYNEDQEIGWRLWLAGLRCVLVPKARMYSQYEFSRSIEKFYWMDRNRILAILECYHILTLILIFPAFVAMELGLILFSLKSGWFKDKIRVWLYFFNINNWVYIWRARKRNQSLRKSKESRIAELITGKIWYQEVDDWKLRAVNPFFDSYWSLIKKFIIW